MLIPLTELEQETAIIATFMGLQVQSNLAEWPDTGAYVHLSEFRYHESWDWLMGVMDKIENLKLNREKLQIIIKSSTSLKLKVYSCDIIVSDSADSIIYKNDPAWNWSKIDAVYEAILHFINWYRSSNNQN